MSSYDVDESRAFYKTVLGWKTHNMGTMEAEPDDRFGMDQVRYHVAMLGGNPAAGIFDMPPFFQKIKMPPFWMSYLAVDDIEGVVARAKAIDGVIVDVEPCPFGDGTMSLIRDPRGAGFTCYDGPSIDSKGDGSEYGRMVWNELITESIPKVEQFYREVIGFDLVRDDEFEGNRVKLINQVGEEVAGVQEVDESIRSEKVYWVPFFSVDSIESLTSRVNEAGGEIISQNNFGGGHDSAICYDNTGAAFGVAETGAEYKDVKPWYRSFF
ncbi:MAG: VOC family protein [Pseudomonadota bacterium]